MPQYLEAALPVLGALFIAILQQDTLPTWANALIAVVLLGVAGLLTAFFGGTLTGHPLADAAVVVSATMALQSVPWAAPYFAYIQKNILVLPKAPPAQPEASGGKAASDPLAK